MTAEARENEKNFENPSGYVHHRHFTCCIEFAGSFIRCIQAWQHIVHNYDA